MREACGHLLSNTECPEYTQQVVHSEVPDGLATLALSTPKGLVAFRREEEQRKKEDTTDFLRNCLDHQMDTLHKHSISRVLVRSRCVESKQKTTLFHKLVQSVFTEGSFPNHGHTVGLCALFDSYSIYNGIFVAMDAVSVLVMSSAPVRPRII